MTFLIAAVLMNTRLAHRKFPRENRKRTGKHYPLQARQNLFHHIA